MKDLLKKLIKKFYYIFFKDISIFIQKFVRTVDEQNFYISKALIVNQVHQENFNEYKNKYVGKDIVIIATAPSLNKYKPIQNTINIGVNKAFLFDDNITLDYIFMMDYSAVKNYINELDNNKYKNIKKFYAMYDENIYGWKERNPVPCIIPESIARRHNAKRYYVYSYVDFKGKTKIFPEIDKTWFANAGSVVFSALQFALFTNPRRIYLVGCDCSVGYFDNSKGANCSFLIKSWKRFKRFADIYYPETEIISVNPVGLKGLFTDLYQE